MVMMRVLLQMLNYLPAKFAVQLIALVGGVVAANKRFPCLVTDAACIVQLDIEFLLYCVVNRNGSPLPAGLVVERSGKTRARSVHIVT